MSNYGSESRAGASELAEETLFNREQETARHRAWHTENTRIHRQRLADMEAEKHRIAQEAEAAAYEEMVERLRQRWRNSGAGSETLFKARLPQLVRDEQQRLMAQDTPDPLYVEAIRSGRYSL